MGDFLKGNKISTLYKQFIAIGAAGTRDGIHATTQQIVWTDDGDDGQNPFPFTAAQDAMQITAAKKIEFRDDAIFINSSGDGVLSLVADGEIDIATAAFDVNATGNVTIDGTGVSIDGTAASNLTVTGSKW